MTCEHNDHDHFLIWLTILILFMMSSRNEKKIEDLKDKLRPKAVQNLKLEKIDE